MAVLFDPILGELRKSDALAASAYVASITGTANQITASASSGAVTLSLPSDVIIDSPDIQVTTTQALAVRNDTDSTSGVTAQWSPAFDFLGHAWKSGLGAADRDVRVRMESQPQTSAGTPNAYFVFKSSTDTGTPVWTNFVVLNTAKPFLDQSVAGAAANNYCTFDTVDTVSSAGSGSTAGFTWARWLSNGTLRLRLDWSAGSAIRFYAPGRLDFESAGQVFFTGTQFFFQAHSSINRTGDASSTATQKDSYGTYWQNSLWTGSASTQRFAGIRSKASTTVNLDHYLKFFLNVTGGVGTEGTEVATMWWDNTTSKAKVGIGVTLPEARFQVVEATLGDEVHRIQSTATNDDPSERTYQNRVATTNATVTTLHTVAIPATTTVLIVARVVARRTGGTAGTAEDGAGYEITATYKNVAGTATEIGETAVYTAESQAGFDCVFTPSGANALLQVTGAADNNLTWHCTVKTYLVSS